MSDDGAGAKIGKPNPYSVAQAQFEKAATLSGLADEIRLILSQPKNELIVNFPVRMDGGGYQLSDHVKQYYSTTRT